MFFKGDKVKGPELGISGPHSEGLATGGVRVAKMLSVDPILWHLRPLCQEFFFRGASSAGILDKKVKAPSWVSRGRTQRGGGGRGLAAWDAVCIDSIILVSDLFVHIFRAANADYVWGEDGIFAGEGIIYGRSASPCCLVLPYN